MVLKSINIFLGSYGRNPANREFTFFSKMEDKRYQLEKI